MNATQLAQRLPILRPFYRTWWERRYGVTSDDVFLVSYPRSGNTWVRFMLLQARPDFHERDFQHIQEIIPDMHGAQPWHTCRRTRVIKSHLTYWQPFRCVIYLVRDGRPATFSNWRYQMAEGKYSGSFHDFVSKPHWPSTWSEHVTAWANAPETKLVVRYEDLIDDPLTPLRKMVDLIGWQVSDSRLEEIVVNSTKERMRELEQGEGVALHRVGDDKVDWREAFDESVSDSFEKSLTPFTKKYLDF